MNEITAVQELFLKTIEHMAFNNCCGENIARDLRAHKHLWRAALPQRPAKPVFVPLQNPVTHPQQISLSNRMNLIALRDLPDNSANFDTVVVWSEPTMQPELDLLARTWNPDEISWYSAKEAFRAMGTGRVKYQEYQADEPALLVAWWD